MSSEDRKGNVGGNKTSDEPPTSPWTPEVIKDFIEQLKPLADSYLQLKQNSLDAQIKKINTIGLHNRRLVYWMVGFLLGVIAFMSVLTFYGKVNGEALLFLVGTVTGFLIVLIQQLLVSPIEESEE